MSRLGINTGSNPNDGQGDPLRVAMGKINSNFTEIYDTFGDGFTLASYASTAGISTLAQNLTGSPRINVSGILNTGITTTEHLEVRNITSTGIITAVQFVGDGSQLENVVATSSGVEVLDENVRKGIAKELNFGSGLFCSGPDGVGRVTIAVTTSIVSGGGTGGTPLEIRNQNTILGEYSKLNFGSNLLASVNPVTGVVTVTTSPGGINISGVSTFNSVVVGGPNTSLVVNGNARITGILTIGTSSLTLDGNNNQIKIGTGVTIRETGSASFNEGINVSGVITATSFKGSGSQLTGVITSLTGYATTSFVTTQIGLNAFTGAASTITSGQISNWNTAYSWGNHALVGYVTSLTLNQLVDVNAGGPSTGQVLKWSGSEWIAGADLSGSGGSGIAYTDLSVTITSPGINSLTYNSLNGVFSFTPAASVNYASSSGVSTTSQGLTGTPSISVNQVGISSYLSVTGIATFYNNVHFDYDKYLLIGSNDELQLFHNGSNSYIDNSAGNNLIIRTHGGAIVLEKEGTEFMGVFNTDGSVELYYNNSKKFETTGAGVTIYGTLNNHTIPSGSGTLALTSNIPSLVGYATTGYVTNALVGYATQGYVNTQIGLNTFTGAASTITSGQISNWNTAYSWGNHASAGYLTNVNITAGSNITVLETSEGNFIITSTASGGGGSSQWTTVASGIITTSNVGIATTNATSALTVVGDGKFTGVVTATRFESSSAGTPTIDSPNNLNINAVTVAISTDVTVARDLYAGINTSTGLILRSPNGSKYRLIVDNSGNLSTILVP